MPEPLIGTLVRDGESGVVGVLQDVLDFVDPAALPGTARPVRTAFVRPLAGGVERGCKPEALVPAGSFGCPHPTLEQREDGKYCTKCNSLIYRTPK
ncbi:hypothetical protein [Streptomyces sulphureus]|uniref:hypothetical protein n=1 Tax=Streptomyces sulphureus TaxID=47758 RepID=UPI00037CCE51|nr:hypothetical protein [Streptomyces sulphureus]